MSALEPLPCRSYVANVTAYLEHHLEEDVASAFEQHTVVCEGCARYLEQTRTTVSLFSRRSASPASRAVGSERPIAAVHAYKFLAGGRVGPFTGFVWPEDGWVSITGPARACRRGVHACRVADLPYWLNHELWVVELAEPVVNVGDKVVSVAGRLAHRVAEWNDEAARRFADHCAARVRDRAVDALEAAGLAVEAERLRSTPDDDVAPQCERLAARGPESIRAACEYGAAAFESLAKPPVPAAAGAAYVAVLAAARATGRDASVAERRDQALWLERELGLTNRHTVQPRRAHQAAH